MSIVILVEPKPYPLYCDAIGNCFGSVIFSFHADFPFPVFIHVTHGGCGRRSNPVRAESRSIRRRQSMAERPAKRQRSVSYGISTERDPRTSLAGKK